MRLYGVVLASLLVFAVADVHGIKVLWMNGEPEKPDMKGKGSAVDDSTDKLLQEAIRNIDQLTNVARSLSQENVAKPPVKSPSRPKVQPKMMMQSKTSPPPTMPSSCRVTFKLKNDQTQPGDTVLAIGSVGALGLWKPDGALKFKTDAKSFPIWTAEVSLPLGTDLDFKFVMQRSSGDLQWENGDNRKLTVPKAAGVTVEGGFGQGGLKTKETGPVAAAPAASAPRAAAGGGGAVESNQRGSSSGTARLHFRVRCETQKGEAVSVCGSLPTIGSWNPKSALPLKTSKDEYPYWSGSTDVALSQVQDMLRYKYLVKKGNEQKWEDAIADRTVKPENKPKGVLAPGLDTFVDDGHFNQLQRVCTYVRDSSEQRQRAGAQSTAITTTQSPAQVPAGMQLVSLDQIRQWEARVTELEGECEELRERAKSAETTVDALNRDLEEERRQNEEIMHQMQFVEELLTRMKKMEDQVTNLEETKEVLVTRSESMGNLQDMNVPTNRGTSVVESIDKGLSGAKQILNNINSKLPAKT
mmetsp:Transcript_48245/g.96582  ORF Transcript_48245/g.96582 Transcript_48245/m.96582 type:complete len:527 (+) Transcript_48245:161-1741(+)